MLPSGKLMSGKQLSRGATRLPSKLPRTQNSDMLSGELTHLFPCRHVLLLVTSNHLDQHLCCRRLTAVHACHSCL